MAGRSGWQTLNRAEFITHLNRSVCLWDFREPERKEKEAWTVEIAEIVETGYLWEGHIACVIRICRVCFIFWGVAVETEASVWENTLSWENPWNVGCLWESASDQIPFVETNQTRGSVYCQKVLFFCRRYKESLTRQLTRCLHIVISEDLCVRHVLGICNHFLKCGTNCKGKKMLRTGLQDKYRSILCCLKCPPVSQNVVNCFQPYLALGAQAWQKKTAKIYIGSACSETFETH